MAPALPESSASPPASNFGSVASRHRKNLSRRRPAAEIRRVENRVIRLGQSAQRQHPERRRQSQPTKSSTRTPEPQMPATNNKAARQCSADMPKPKSTSPARTSPPVPAGRPAGKPAKPRRDGTRSPPPLPLPDTACSNPCAGNPRGTPPSPQAPDRSAISNSAISPYVPSGSGISHLPPEELLASPAPSPAAASAAAPTSESWAGSARTGRTGT